MGCSICSTFLRDDSSSILHDLNIIQHYFNMLGRRGMTSWVTNSQIRHDHLKKITEVNPEASLANVIAHGWNRACHTMYE